MSSRLALFSVSPNQAERAALVAGFCFVPFDRERTLQRSSAAVNVKSRAQQSAQLLSLR